ncbi:MAG: potassium-transporting ATPase subunit KdpC [Ignavibacteriae bacterium]|nr:potassium-transporting ATPase subunit KdpC [Ignavibacteriota bacterium]
MKIIITSIKFLLLTTLLTGILYPLFIFGIAKIIFPGNASGSFIELKGNIIGSELIAQKFDSSIYFQSRPSTIDYQPIPSGASNLGPTSRKLKDISDSLKKAYVKKNYLPENANIPPDAIFSSGSGIDPHISPENAMLQMDRIAVERKFDANKKKELKNLIHKLTENPQFGFLGEPRLNVLVLNLELDKLLQR